MKRDKIRHHFVPKALIQRFTGATNSIMVFDATTDRSFLTNPRDAFVQSDYHSLFSWDGAKDRNTIENLIEEVESLGLQAIATLIEQKRFGDELRRALAALWSLQLVRTPPVREAAEAFIRGQVKYILRAMEKNHRIGPIPEALKPFGENLHELVENNVVRIDLLPQVGLLSLSAFETIFDVLLTMRWTFLVSNNQKVLLV